MPTNPSDPSIDILVRSQDEENRRLVGRLESDTVEIDKLADTVRIHRPPRAQTPDREMLRQPWMQE